MTNMILHVDGDNFFVSCEMTHLPHLKGKAVVVGMERGIACAMNQEAKKLGIVRAMPIFKIRKEFPEVIVLPSHFELYHTYSKRLSRILKRYTNIVEDYSIDECFAILSEKEMATYGSWDAYIAHIKNVVQGELGITFSFGLADTKVLTKVASSIKKPDGCTVLYKEEVLSVLQNTRIEKVWGIGSKLSKSLLTRGITTAFKFTQIPIDIIQRQYAKPVQELWYELSGTRIYGVQNHTADQKSVQTVRSFRGTYDKEYILSELSRNIEVVFARVQKQKLLATSATFFLKYDVWEYTEVHISFDQITMDPRECIQKALEAFPCMYKQGIKYKGTGITLHGLTRGTSHQKDLFGYQEESTDARMISAINQIRERFGKTSINYVSSMNSVIMRGNEDKATARTDSYIHNLPLPYLGEVC